MPPRRGAKRKSDVVDDDPNSLAALGRLAPDQPPTKHSRGSKLARLEDSGDEVSEDDRYDLERWVKWQASIKKKDSHDSKKSIEAFEALTAKREAAALARLHRLDGDLCVPIVALHIINVADERGREQDEVKLSLTRSKAYALITGPETNAPAATRAATNSLSRRQALADMVDDQLNRSRGMVDYYTSMDETFKSERHRFEPPTDQFDRDKKDLRLLISYGRQVGESLVGGHLAPHTFTPLSFDKSQTSSYQQTAADMFTESRKTIPEGFGAKLSEQIEGFTRLVGETPSQNDTD